MPPKRKNKALEMSAATPIKAQPAELAHPKRRNSSVQGGKTSRLPSIALHMTTRRAAKTASNHTSSGAPSLASSDSRRSSLNSIAHYEDAPSEIVDERPAKRARLSTDSGSPQPSATPTVDQSTVNGTHTPEQRKPPSNPISNGSKTSKKRRASDQSTQSSKTVSARPNHVLTRTESDVSESLAQQPRRKKRKITTHTLADSADVPPELTDASTAPNSPEQLAEVHGSQILHHVLPTNGDAPAKLGRRLPGRRRAPHPDVNVEIDLRRQLNLKMSYRSLAKIQKQILEELSSRTTNYLENDPDYYKQVPAYEPLMAGLDQRKANRLAELEALRGERLDQLERVRIATEHIEREKYIQRFQDLQEDLLLQCFYRMKQIDREAKGQEAEATDDEDNVVHATRMDFPTVYSGDRLASKYASRSRAYVDTQQMLDEDIHRKRLGELQATFVAQDDDADDSIEEIPAGFGAFNGPDRTDAVAHWNITSLLDAAEDIESAPLQPLPPKVIPNEQADALFLLASLSGEEPRATFAQVKPEQQEQEMLPAELTRVSSPVGPVLQVAETTFPVSENVPVEAPRYSTPILESNGMQPAQEQRPPKNETHPRSTHRIMDMLNDDAEVPVSKLREAQPPAHNQTPAAIPSRRKSISQGLPSLMNGTLGRELIANPLDAAHTVSRPPESQAASSSLPSNGPPSWSTVNRFAHTSFPRMPSYKAMSEESLRKRDPMHTIRALLDAKTISEGRIPGSQRRENKINAERDQAREAAASQTRPFSASGVRENPEPSGQDAIKPPVAAYTTSPPAPPLSYHQSPNAAPAYPPPPRSDSQDTSSSHWGRDRRLSGSQAPRDRRLSGSQAPRPPSASPFAGRSPQPYHPEPSMSSSNQAPRSSPYATPSAPQLPSISSTLPSKPPGPPPSAPINFRFAHYDPAPPRPSSYPTQVPSSGPSTSQPSPYAAAPPPQHQASGYGKPPSNHNGYVPPPGSFQAPPPPPTSLPAYPPLKIHQYGGQPILPANMAPPPLHSQSQQPMTFVGQSAPPSAYSPPQQQSSLHRRTPSYEHIPGGPQDSIERANEGSSRQRRQYRSYHAPGTQFRSYQGPDSGRRRGG